jgi:radical SAM protein with 4Fe4S-binding SPASM domain
VIEKLPYQIYGDSVVALLPSGNVEFLHPDAAPVIDSYNSGRSDIGDLDSLIIDHPWVDLEQFHLSAPAIAFVEITNLCNLTCTHCYAFSGPKRNEEMTTADIKALLDRLADLGTIQVFLTGGEVFAHKDAIEIINHARSKPFSTQIFTNGTLISRERLHAIPAGQSFFVSFDTASPERSIRGKMDFPKLTRMYEWMRECNHVLRTAISVHHQNIEDVEEIFEWCVENDFPRPQWLETHPIGRALINPHILLQPDRVNEVFAIYQRCMDRFQHKRDDESISELPEHVSGAAAAVKGVQTIKFCQRVERATQQEKCGRSVAYINSQGFVYPCSNCMSNDMYRAGNIRDRDFKDIWDNDFSKFRDISYTDYQSCQSCDVFKDDIWCQFRCPPLALNVSGSELGCGATAYLRRFMIMSNAYWRKRELDGFTLKIQGHSLAD